MVAHRGFDFQGMQRKVEQPGQTITPVFCRRPVRTRFLAYKFDEKACIRVGSQRRDSLIILDSLIEDIGP